MRHSYPEIVRAWLDGDASLTKMTTPEQRRAIGLIAAGSATEEHFAGVGVPFIVGIKSHLSLERRSQGELVERAEKDDLPENVIRWKLSDEKPDRMGDIIKQDGWDFRNYKKNPVLLWSHASGLDSHADEPIGRALDLWTKGTETFGDFLFAVEESDVAARKHRLARGGFIRAGSVGFRPLKTQHVSDEAERTKLGLGRFGVVFEKSELLEFSLCAIPANADALQQSIKSGAITEADADELAAQATEKDWEQYMRRRARSFVAMSAATDPVADALRALAESQSALADSIAALTRSQVDLGARLGAAPASPQRAADAGRADAGINKADAERLRKQLEELTAKL